MSYISGDLLSEKGVASQLLFDKNGFIAATTFTDPYFQNDLNWEKVVIFYEDETFQQEEPVILKSPFDEGAFLVSIFSRTGAWLINRIQIFDKDGDFYTVSRLEMPNPEDFDLDITRILCQESDVSSVSAVDKVTLVPSEAEYYKIGFKVKLWDVNAVGYLSSEVYEIIDINGDEITFDINVNPAHSGKTLQLVFAMYHDASPEQQGNYVYLDVGF